MLKAHAVSFTLPVYAVLRYWGVLVLSGCLFKSEIGKHFEYAGPYLYLAMYETVSSSPAAIGESATYISRASPP